MPNDASIVAPLLAGFMVISVVLLTWFALRSAGAHQRRHQEFMALYRRGLALTETGQQLQAESNSTMRELIAELRAARHAPGPPSAPEQLSNSPSTS
jgi:hypothetical protein